MKKKYFIALFTCMTSVSIAQKKIDLGTIKSKEDSLYPIALSILQGASPTDRFVADSTFKKIFVRALKTPNSFYYPFDSLFTISKLYPPDSSFRIFTWHLVVDENFTKQSGAIQMKTEDGSLKLFPLIDQSDRIDNIEDTITNHLNWVGAIYYNLIPVIKNKVPYYTLIGFDENNARCSRKIIEILHFENGQPVFGDRVFSYPKDTVCNRNAARYIMTYKKEAAPRLRYDEDLKIIIKEHLVSLSNQPEQQWTLVGDGDYEGFKWSNNQWNYILKVYDQITPKDQVPKPKPVTKEKLIIE